MILLIWFFEFKTQVRVSENVFCNFMLLLNIFKGIMTITNCRLISLPKIQDQRGNLTFIESNQQIPFELKRVYYLYDVPGGENRAGHSLKTCHQFLIAASGSFDVTVTDGQDKKIFHLNRSYYGLYIPPMLWRELDNFSSGSVCLALVSTFYDANDYYRDYELYLEAMKS